MKLIFVVITFLFATSQCCGIVHTDSVDILEGHIGSGYKSSLGYLGFKFGYLPPFFNRHLQLTAGLGFTVFQRKSSVGMNLFLTTNKERLVWHVGGDYVLGWGGNVQMDSGDKVRFNFNHYVCPYAGIKFSTGELGSYVNIQIGYNFLLTPQPNLRISNPARLTAHDIDYLNRYVQRRVDGGFMVMVSLSGDFCRRYRQSHKK